MKIFKTDNWTFWWANGVWILSTFFIYCRDTKDERVSYFKRGKEYCCFTPRVCCSDTVIHENRLWMFCVQLEAFHCDCWQVNRMRPLEFQRQTCKSINYIQSKQYRKMKILRRASCVSVLELAPSDYETRGMCCFSCYAGTWCGRLFTRARPVSKKKASNFMNLLLKDYAPSR